MHFFLTNCEKESFKEEVILVQDQEPTITLKHYSKTNIEKNAKLLSRLKEFNDELTKNKSSKLSGKKVYNEEFDFTIYTNSATYIEDGDYHSYTFPLVQDDDEKITNIFFELNDKDEYDGYLIFYDYSANEFKHQNLNSLSLKTSLKPIDLDFNSLFAKTKQAYVCFYDYTGDCCDNYVPGKGCGELTGANYYNPGCDWMITAYCESVLYYDQDYKKYHQGNTATVTIGGTIYSGTGRSRTSPIASPFSREELIQIDIVKNRLNLSPPEKLWIDKWENGQIAFKLHDFLEADMFSDKAIKLGKLAIEAFMNDETLEFEALIELINGMDKDCQTLIFYKSILKVNSTFTNLIKDSYLALNKPNISFIDIAVGEGEPALISSEGARTQPYLGTSESGEPTVIIEFNNDYLDQSTDLGLINTLYHELLHAHILNLYHEGKLLTKYPSYTSLNTALNNYYSDDTNIIFGEVYIQEMHNIYVDFIDLLAGSLVEYAATNNISGIDLDYAKKLVWGGLKGNNVFTDNLTIAQQKEYQTLLGKENFNHSDAKSSKTCN